MANSYAFLLTQEANGDNLGNFSYLLHNNGMLSVLIRIASMVRFY